MAEGTCTCTCWPSGSPPLLVVVNLLVVGVDETKVEGFGDEGRDVDCSELDRSIISYHLDFGLQHTAVIVCVKFLGKIVTKDVVNALDTL